LSVEELTVEVVFLEEHFDLIASRRLFPVFHAFFYDRDEHLSVYTGLIWASYLGKVIDDIVDVLFKEVVESRVLNVLTLMLIELHRGGINIILLPEGVSSVLFGTHTPSITGQIVVHGC